MGFGGWFFFLLFLAPMVFELWEIAHFCCVEDGSFDPAHLESANRSDGLDQGEVTRQAPLDHGPEDHPACQQDEEEGEGDRQYRDTGGTYEFHGDHR